MAIGLAFWILMLLWLFFGVWQAAPDWKGRAPGFLLFVLLLLLGWAAFGPPIRD